MGQRKRTDLKSELLAAAQKLINQEGADALSLRKLARDVGASTMSTYYHFENKKALLVAVGIKGFNELEQCMTAALEKAKTPADAIESTMQAYFRFAREKRHLYYLMFVQLNEERHSIPELRNAAKKGFYLIAQAAKNHMDKNGHELDLDAVGLCFWAILHGRVCLATEGTILDGTRPGIAIKNLIDDGIRSLFHIQEPAGFD